MIPILQETLPSFLSAVTHPSHKNGVTDGENKFPLFPHEGPKNCPTRKCGEPRGVLAHWPASSVNGILPFEQPSLLH